MSQRSKGQADKMAREEMTEMKKLIGRLLCLADIDTHPWTCSECGRQLEMFAAGPNDRTVLFWRDVDGNNALQWYGVDCCGNKPSP